MVAAVASLGVVGILRSRVSGRGMRAWTAGVGMLAILLIALYVAVQGWAPALDNARQSLGYRLEYWQSSVPVILEQPLVGVGFGNFRSHYLAYKLPHSSEEIQDPHNFLVELATCGGLVALLSYLAWLWLACHEVATCLATHDESPLQPWWLFVSLPLAVSLLGLSSVTANRIPEGIIIATVSALVWLVLARYGGDACRRGQQQPY